MFFRHDKTRATHDPAMTRMILVPFKVIPIIVKDFFAFGDIADRDHPDLPPDDLNFAIRVAGMIDVAGDIVGHIPVNVMLFIKLKNVYGALGSIFLVTLDRCRDPALSLLLCDSFSHIFNDPGTLGNIRFGKDPFSVDGRLSQSDQWVVVCAQFHKLKRLGRLVFYSCRKKIKHRDQ